MALVEPSTSFMLNTMSLLVSLRDNKSKVDCSELFGFVITNLIYFTLVAPQRFKHYIDIIITLKHNLTAQ